MKPVGIIQSAPDVRGLLAGGRVLCFLTILLKRDTLGLR